MSGPLTPNDLRPLEDSWGWRITGGIMRSSLFALAIGIGVSAWGLSPHPLHIAVHAEKAATFEVTAAGRAEMPDGGKTSDKDMDFVASWTPFWNSWQVELTTTIEGDSGWCQVGDGPKVEIHAPGTITCRSPLAELLAPQ